MTTGPRFPWETPVWSPTADDVRLTRKGRALAVHVVVTPTEALERAWVQLGRELTAGEGTLLDGGASLRCLPGGLVEVCSGGEDSLSSLSWAINQTLFAAVREADLDAVVAVDGVRQRD